MAINNREISQNGLIMSLHEEVDGLKGSVIFWKDRTKSKLLEIEEMNIRIYELEKENDEYRISIANDSKRGEKRD